MSSPTLGVAGHTTVAAAVTGCQTCHETAPYIGMLASTASTAEDSRPTAFDTNHPTSGDCGTCHTTTPTFAGDVTPGSKPSNHIPTTAACTQCHTTAGNYALYSVTGTHQGVTGCLTCHGPTVGPFANVTIVTTPANHMPIGSLDCNGAGCHATTNVNPGGFKLGTASISSPTLSVAGHTTAAAAVGACNTCHETAPYIGMLASTASIAGDSRPTALDAIHPATGDCGGCHTTTPTFASDQTGNAKPANHIPTTAACAQCHTTAGNNAAYSVTGTHQGVTGCLSCHGSTVATTFANVTIVTNPANHMPFGSLDCNGSGCHATTNVNPGGFKLGSASISSPTLSVAGHATVAAAVGACDTCHETAPYIGMLASTASMAGDSRPTTLDAIHPTTGDCGGCHTTTPTFAGDVTPGSKPSNHIPTSAPCAQCHTTPSNYALYSVTGTHQGVTGCLSCHGSTVATTFGNVTIVTNPANHIPFGSLDCNGSGCHSTSNVTPGGFKLGTASLSSPTLSVAGHTTVAAVVGACDTCHETAPYIGMLASSASAAGDSRPTAVDKSHPASGDCGNCHVTTPTFATNLLPTAPKPVNHIPTTAVCAQCHTTAGNYALYSVTGTHQGITDCLSCHGSTVATTFANVTRVTNPANHMPFGVLDCGGSGCHSTTNVNAGGFKIGTASIASPTLTVAGHTTVAAAVTGCSTCHETAFYIGMVASTATTAGDSRPTAFDKAHPTTGDCNGCHTTTPTFASDQTGNAKPANHIPTSAPCAQCHSTAGNDAVYSVTGTHQGVTGCLSCHGSTVATTFVNVTIVTTPASHMPIGTLDCNGSGCHSTTNVNPGGFKLGAANISSPTLTVAGHTTVAAAVAGCQTCHETSPYIGMVASSAATAGDSRPTAFDKAHPTTGDCNGCHTPTPTFTSNVTSGTKPTNHIPTNAPCAQCHTTAGNFAAYVMGATGHAGITSNCAQCHGYGLSFYNMAAPTLKQPVSGATGHIPAVPPNGTTVIACELCHSPSVFTTFSGTVMKHAYVVAMKCDACHEYNMTWQTNSGAQLWTRPSPNHHAGQDCNGSGCHNSRDKRAVRPAPRAVPGAAGTPFDHHTVAGTPCASCHDSARGSGKPPGHITSSDSCQSCHTTLAWLPVTRVDHAQVRGTCVSCHNGTAASGKPANHVPTSAGCERCHTTNGWTPARFDHAAVAAHTCTTCHNSVQAIGLSRTHIPTRQQCDVCHGTLAWKPALIDHSRFVSACAGCHNNQGAVGLSAGHMSTRRDCSTCHSYPDWSVIRFRHVAAAYPGDHRAALACISCHTSNTDQVPYASPGNAGTCAGCHAKDFKPAAHPKTLKGQNYTVSELANCTLACHVYRDPTFSTIARSLPGPHHRVVDATFRR
ncbi:MAG: cytochrome c3 family protein [Steroidobacteraceae bacterium]